MAIQLIDIGSYANDGTGDDLRTAFFKINSNFQNLIGLFGDTSESFSEVIRGIVAAMFLNGTHEGLTITYDNQLGTFNVVTDSALIIDGGPPSSSYDETELNIDGGRI